MSEEYTLDVELKQRLHYRRLQRLNGTRNRKAQTTTSQTLGCSSHSRMRITHALCNCHVKGTGNTARCITQQCNHC